MVGPAPAQSFSRGGRQLITTLLINELYCSVRPTTELHIILFSVLFSRLEDETHPNSAMSNDFQHVFVLLCNVLVPFERESQMSVEARRSIEWSGPFAAHLMSFSTESCLAFVKPMAVAPA